MDDFDQTLKLQLNQTGKEERKKCEKPWRRRWQVMHRTHTHTDTHTHTHRSQETFNFLRFSFPFFAFGFEFVGEHCCRANNSKLPLCCRLNLTKQFDSSILYDCGIVDCLCVLGNDSDFYLLFRSQSQLDYSTAELFQNDVNATYISRLLIVVPMRWKENGWEKEKHSFKFHEDLCIESLSNFKVIPHSFHFRFYATPVHKVFIIRISYSDRWQDWMKFKMKLENGNTIWFCCSTSHQWKMAVHNLQQLKCGNCQAASVNFFSEWVPAVVRFDFERTFALCRHAIECGKSIGIRQQWSFYNCTKTFYEYCMHKRD